jgi:hypothetical protein
MDPIEIMAVEGEPGTGRTAGMRACHRSRRATGMRVSHGPGRASGTRAGTGMRRRSRRAVRGRRAARLMFFLGRGQGG